MAFPVANTVINGGGFPVASGGGSAGYALVGSLGALTPASGAGTTTVSPPWGTGSSQTMGNLLVCWCVNPHATTIPATPSGWSVAKSTSGILTSFGAGVIFYKIAAGGDTAPTITGSLRLYAQLAEFSGNAAASVLDQVGAADLSTNASGTITAGGTDAATGELLLFLGSGVAGTGITGSGTLNNATATQAGSGQAGQNDKFAFGYGISTANASASSTTITWSSTTSESAGIIVSFKHS